MVAYKIINFAMDVLFKNVKTKNQHIIYVISSIKRNRYTASPFLLCIKVQVRIVLITQSFDFDSFLKEIRWIIRFKIDGIYYSEDEN